MILRKGLGCKGFAVLELAFIFIMLFVFVFISFYGFKILDDLEPDIQEDLVLNESKEMYENIHSRYPNVFDGLFMLLFVGAWIFVVVAASMSTDHPILFVSSIVIMVFIIISIVILGNFYEEYFADASVAGLAANFPMANWIFSHILPIVLGIGFSIVLAMYLRNRI